MEVIQAAKCEVVWPLLAVRAQHKRAAVGLVAEKLQRGLSTGLEWLYVWVFAGEGVGIELQGKGGWECGAGRAGEQDVGFCCRWMGAWWLLDAIAGRCVSTLTHGLATCSVKQLGTSRLLL
jgi:hypothetical protein